MINKEEALKQLKEMPIDKFQEALIKALDESGIKYKIGGEQEDGFVSLSEFFYEGWLTDENKRPD